MAEAEQEHKQGAKKGDAHGGKDHGGGGHGHGGGHDEGHEGAPEWLISFADNVTLLMGFFVIMLALNMGLKGGATPSPEQGGDSETPPPAYLDAVLSIREAFNNPVNLNSMDPNDKVLVRHLMERRGEAQADQDGPPGDEHKLQSLRPSDYAGLCTKVPFETNSSELGDAGRQAVSDVSKHLRGLRLIVEVRGHVSRAEAFASPDRGMDLSFDRAMAVARLLSEEGVDWRRLRVVACGDNDRVEQTVYGLDKQRVNQRVEVMVTEQTIPLNAPSTQPADGQ